MKKYLLLGALFLSSCMCPQWTQNLRRIEKQTDSILTLLQSMQSKHDYMAQRMGWRPPPDTTPKEIPIQGSPVLGPDNAKMVLVEFIDLQCPYCAQWAQDLEQFQKENKGDVKVIYKHFPLSFHPEARNAAAAALAAGNQGKFWEYRFLIASQLKEFKDSTYMAVAKNLGLEMTKFTQDRKDSSIYKLIDRDMELGRKIGVEGTPTLFINGSFATDRSLEYLQTKLKKLKAN